MEGALPLVVRTVSEDAPTGATNAPLMRLHIRVALQVLLKDIEDLRVWFKAEDLTAWPPVTGPDGESAEVCAEVDNETPLRYPYADVIFSAVEYLLQVRTERL